MPLDPSPRRALVLGGAGMLAPKSQHITIEYRVLKNGVDAP
jgi:hypothetical protein